MKLKTYQSTTSIVYLLTQYWVRLNLNEGIYELCVIADNYTHSVVVQPYGKNDKALSRAVQNCQRLQSLYDSGDRKEYSRYLK